MVKVDNEINEEIRRPPQTHKHALHTSVLTPNQQVEYVALIDTRSIKKQITTIKKQLHLKLNKETGWMGPNVYQRWISLDNNNK